MSDLKSVLIFLAVLSAPFTVLGAEYPCELSYDTGTCCTISGLHLTRENYAIKPSLSEEDTGADLTSYEYFRLENSVVPILSKEICKSLPNMNHISAQNVSIEEIEAGAFQDCKKLKQIQLQDNNKLKNLKQNTFKGLPKLERLLLRGGHLPVVDLDLTDSKQLKELHLIAMNIVIFPAETLREQTNLKELRLDSNRLFDLDIDQILKFTPNLKQIYLNENNFKCSRLREIFSKLEENDVDVITWYDSEYFRIRDYEAEYEGSFKCLSDEQWETELSKIDLSNYSGSLEQLRKVAFGIPTEKLIIKT